MVAITKKERLTVARFLAVAFAFALSFSAFALDYLEQIPVETFAKMREVERYQIKVAEKFYTQGNYKIAAVEYEKYLTLYEKSLAAPYAQLMWSHCQVKQRKVYTAIRDGFRSVIDYWPESHEAAMASLLIGKSYKRVGELKNAIKAYRLTVLNYPTHYISVLAKWDLADIYREMNDQASRVEVWENLTYKTKRTKQNSYYTTHASCYLGQHLFYTGNFAEGLKAIETTYKGTSLIRKLYQYANGPISSLTGNTEKKVLGEKLANEFIAFIEKQVPTDVKSKTGLILTREYFYIIADIHSCARHDAEGLAVYARLGKLLGVDDNLRGRQASWNRARKRFAEARKIYGQYTDRVTGQVNIALTYRRYEGNPEQAVAVYNQLIGLEKKREGEWHENIVNTWREAKQWDKALVTYQTLLKVVPARFGDWYWGIADCHERRGRLPQAVQSYRQSDKYPSAYFAMASCHRRLKQYKEALVLYHQARADRGSAPDASIHIAYTYEEYGQKENAIKWFQQTCKLYPKHSRASQAHAHLQNKYKISVTLGGANEKK
ncbi:MAG: tetratricopeptide repeat protein [Verrucomicrobiota bacterium]|nr:tetratricopeptide repeat protein [Verrucomicrobiota bacterium]